MGIYIPGMKMPTSCDKCPCFSEDDSCGVTGSWKFADEFDKEKERLPDCPLVHVPPHGRLIDADFIVKHLRKQIQDVGEDTELANRGREFISIIGAVSTIIPAEEGET